MESIMEEHDWFLCNNPVDLLNYLDTGTTKHPVMSDRKLRLLAVAYGRTVVKKLADQRSRLAIKIAEKFADGLVTKAELSAAAHGAWEVTDGVNWADCKPAFMAWVASDTHIRNSLVNNPHLMPLSTEQQIKLIYDIFGNPFKPAYRCQLCNGTGQREESDEYERWTVECGCKKRPVPLTWITQNVIRLAQTIYDSNVFTPDRMSILGDAIEESGCANQEVLLHCRGLHLSNVDEGEPKFREGQLVRIVRNLHAPQEVGWKDPYLNKEFVVEEVEELPTTISTYNYELEGGLYRHEEELEAVCGPHRKGCWVIDTILNKR
jgi:hypothetical protein